MESLENKLCLTYIYMPYSRANSTKSTPSTDSDDEYRNQAAFLFPCPSFGPLDLLLTNCFGHRKSRSTP